MINDIIWPVAALGGLGLLLGLGLAIASKFLSVKSDPRIDTIRALLPGANCGGCGYPGCDGFAKALVEGTGSLSQCSVLDADNFKQIAGLLGVDTKEGEKMVARILCRGGTENCLKKYKYFGISDCRAASTLAGGPSSCSYGCVGLLTCAKECPFDAIHLSENGIAEIDEDKCTGCGKCVAVCPKHSIALVPKAQAVYVRCHAPEKGKSISSVCKAGCIGCNLCVKKCPEGAITMLDNIPVIDYNKCTHCGTCVAVCPKGVIAGPVNEDALPPAKKKALAGKPAEKVKAVSK
jgi:electron transport complex protein RnfB